jgi:hypothetical protein
MAQQQTDSSSYQSLTGLQVNLGISWADKFIKLVIVLFSFALVDNFAHVSPLVFMRLL